MAPLLLSTAPASAPVVGASVQHAASGLEVASAQGSWVATPDGRRFLDLTSGMASSSLGHGHPSVLAAVRRQIDALVQTGGVFGHASQRELAARLGGIAPRGIDRFAFAASGTEAVELALRLARMHTGCDAVVCFRGGFHGRTHGSAQATTGVVVPGVPGAAGGVIVAPFPHAGRGGDPGERTATALAALDRIRRRHCRIAAYLVEPVQGYGGCHPAGRAFLAGLRERCDHDGALLVFDEAQTGLGRTGEWFAAQTYGVAPDVLCIAKALGGGLPLSAVGASAAVWESVPDGACGSTFGGSPPSCAAGCAVIDVIAREGLVARAASLGAVLARLLARLAAARPWLAARSLGLMAGLEVRSIDGRADAAGAEAVRRECLRLGVVVGRAGRHGNVVRLLPSLTIADSDLRHGIDVLSRSLGAIEARSTRLAHAA